MVKHPDPYSENTAEEKKLWQLLDEVNDPEVPVLSVIDLGIIREVKLLPSPVGEEQEVEVSITPTYSGCPAMETIRASIQKTLLDNGYRKVKITTVLSPAWTTDWMTES